MRRLTIAFASLAHVSLARDMLAVGRVPVRRMIQPGSSGDLAVVELDIPVEDLERVVTLVEGVHGIVLRTEQLGDPAAG